LASNAAPDPNPAPFSSVGQGHPDEDHLAKRRLQQVTQAALGDVEALDIVDLLFDGVGRPHLGEHLTGVLDAALADQPVRALVLEDHADE
jgi:hypothetical protein